MACVCSTNNCYSLPQGPLGEVFRLSDDGVANLAARGRRLIGRVAGAAGPDRRGGEAGDAPASSRSRNKADGCAPPATRRAPGVCRRRTVLLVDDALASPPRRALPADARSLAHGLSGLLPRAVRRPPVKNLNRRAAVGPANIRELENVAETDVAAWALVGVFPWTLGEAKD